MMKTNQKVQVNALAGMPVQESPVTIIEVPKASLFEKINTLYKNDPTLSTKEIAGLLGCKVSTVGVYLCRIKKGAQTATSPKPKKQRAPKQIADTSSKLIALSIENSSPQSIQTILNGIVDILRENESYTLNIDISKQA